MDWQQLASLLIVGATALAFVGSLRRSRTERSGCGSLCGCSSVRRDIPQKTIIFRGRKGERSRVIIKAG